MNNSITIYQKDWAFTTADSKTPVIITGGFGPCYVGIFTCSGKKVVAMAHIDDNTQVESMEMIFQEFQRNNIKLEEVNVTLLGGWKEHPESLKWGIKIVTILTKAGFKNIDRKQMLSKQMPTAIQFMTGVRREEKVNYYFPGISVDARTGSFTIAQRAVEKIERAQDKKTQLFAQQFGCGTTQELPLTRIS